MKRKFILRFKFFLSALFLSTIIFTSCNNLTDAASLEPTDKNEVILESATAATSASADENYVTLSGSLSTGGAYPEEIARTLSGEKVTEDSSSRSAFPAVSTTDNSLTYSITAKYGSQTCSGTISTDKKSYTVSIPVQSEAMTCTVEASIFKGTDKLFTGESESFTISRENQVVEVPAITLKALSSGNGSIELEIDVEGSGISYCIVKLGENMILEDNGNTKKFLVSSNKITVTKSDVDAKVYLGEFSFYDSSNVLIYSFREYGINVISNMTTNTWVKDGDEPWFSTTGTGTSKTTTCRITSAMVDSFKLTQIYVDPSRSTTEGESNYTRESGTFINPCTSFSKAIEKLTDATKDYTIYITGTLTGPQTIPSDIRAKTLTLTGTTGSTTDIFDGNQRGSALTISSSVPVIIRNLMITNGGPSVDGGGINMASGTYVELSDGVIVSGNSITGKNGGGVYNNGGNLYLNGNAVIGKKGNEVATSSDFGNKVSGSGAGAGIYNGNNGKVLLGYKYDGSAAGKYVAATLEGGVYRNYLANTTPSSAYGGGIYNERGTVMMSGERAYVAYNYAINGAGIALGGSASASLVMNGGVIEGNQSNSDGDGAGVYCKNGSSITMESGSVIRNNKNARNGGGVYLNYDNCSLTMNGGTIEGNEVKSGGNGGAVYMHGMSSDSKSSFKVSGDAYIPCPDGKGKNDVYILDITSITVAGNLNRDYVASISGNSTYVIKTGYAILTNASGQSYLSSNYTKFSVISNDTKNWVIDSEGKLKSIIGTKIKPNAVGDIVFNDGSATPYTDGMTITDAQKLAAIALIFYKGTDLNSDAADGTPDTTTVRTLGVGLKHDSSGLTWCASNAAAYSKKITTIVCPASGSSGSYTFTVDKNGSDNFEQIEAFEGIDDTSTAEKYPAFYFAKNYAISAVSNIAAASEFATGWYLPSIAEVFQIYANVKGADKTFDIEAASVALGGDTFGDSIYWSSSQDSSSDSYVSIFGFQGGQVGNLGKYNVTLGIRVCCIREF